MFLANRDVDMREILIVTTFKEFDGGRDAKIQEYWLSELHKQTYKNFKLVVTNFREKNVKKTLEDSLLPYTYYQSETDCLLTITEMFENTVHSVVPGEHIILWPSPDHMFDENFFECIANNFEAGTGGTSFPHSQYLCLSDYADGKMYDEYYDRKITSVFDYDPNKHIPETFYFDADLLLDKEWKKQWSKHKIIGTFPGIGLHLLLQSMPNKLVNILFYSKIHKIISHVNPETGKLDSAYFGKSHRSNKLWIKNLEIIIDFCKCMGVAPKYWKGTLFRTRKLVMFSRYSPLGTWQQKLRYLSYIFFFSIFPEKEFILKKKVKSLKRKIIKKYNL